MHSVEIAVEHPGTCALTGTSTGPFIQTGLLTRFDAGGGTQYVSRQMAIELGLAAGCAHPDVAADIAMERDMLEVEVARLREVEAEHQRLVEAVGYTLKNGAVARRGEVVLRTPPGKPKVTLPA